MSVLLYVGCSIATIVHQSNAFVPIIDVRMRPRLWSEHEHIVKQRLSTLGVAG